MILEHFLQFSLRGPSIIEIINLALFGGHYTTMKTLILAGQPINVKTTRHRWTPLMFGVWRGDVHLVREILRRGAHHVVNHFDCRPDGSEWTPLSLAVARHKPDLVNTLVSCQADPLCQLSFADFPSRAYIQVGTQY